LGERKCDPQQRRDETVRGDEEHSARAGRSPGRAPEMTAEAEVTGADGRGSEHGANGEVDAGRDGPEGRKARGRPVTDP
jgi:hypothetical protein